MALEFFLKGPANWITPHDASALRQQLHAPVAIPLIEHATLASKFRLWYSEHFLYSEHRQRAIARALSSSAKERSRWAEWYSSGIIASIYAAKEECEKLGVTADKALRLEAKAYPSTAPGSLFQKAIHYQLVARLPQVRMETGMAQ